MSGSSRSGPETEPFDSLSALYRAHTALLQNELTSPDGAPLPVPEVQRFVARVQATLPALEKDEHLEMALRVRDYWNADLLNPSRDAGPEPLEPSGPLPEAAGSGAGAGQGHSSDTGKEGRLRQGSFPVPAALRRKHIRATLPGAQEQPLTEIEARDYIRFAALARQWRATRQKGLLLGSDAIQTARRFRQDPDIAELIDASIAQGLRLRNILLGTAGLVMVAVLGLAASAFHLKGVAEQERHEVQEQLGEATAWTAEARAAEAAAREANEGLQASVSRLETESSRMREVEIELTKANQRAAMANRTLAHLIILREIPAREIPEDLYSDVVDAMATGLREGTLQRWRIPPDFHAEVLKRAPILEWSAQAMQNHATGYDPGFLAIALDLPRPDPALVDTVELKYLNFTVLYDRMAQRPVLAGANWDRSARLLLPAADAVPLAQDERIEVVSGMERDDPSLGFLVRQGYISWGPKLDGLDPLAAGYLVDHMVSFSPNRIVFSAQGAVNWMAVRNWIWTRHNPAASRVTLYSGPIFAGDARAGSPPDQLWIMAISSADPLAGQSQRAQTPVVDVFLVSNLDTGTAPSAPSPDPETFRTTLEEVAAKAGLRFDPKLTVAPAIDDPDQDRRSTAAEQLANALRDGGLDPEQRAAQLEVLRDLLARHEELSPEGQITLLRILSDIPAGIWQEPDWQRIYAPARSGVAALLARHAGSDALGPAQIAALQLALGLAPPPGQETFIQFSGFTRERIQAVSEGLAALGWTIAARPERLGSAEGKAEVRYNPGTAADAAAASLLAGDLGLLAAVEVRPQPFDAVAPGRLEIWIGN